jgi:hypothetical protein
MAAFTVCFGRRREKAAGGGVPEVEVDQLGAEKPKGRFGNLFSFAKFRS